MAVNDIFKLAVIWNTSGNNAEVVNRWAFRQVDALPADEPGPDLVDAFLSKALATYIALACQNFTIQSYEVRGLTTPTYGYDQNDGVTTGTLTGDVLPFQSSAVISWRTALIGRANRGRTYLPPMNEGSQSSGIIAAGYLTAMAAFAEDMITEMNTTDVNHSAWELGIWGPVTGTPTFKPVTAALIRNIIGSQRRRRPGVGS